MSLYVWQMLTIVIPNLLPCVSPAGSLSKVAYGVFGVGNSQWAQTYQAFPSQVDLQLAKAGATRVSVES